MSAIPRTTRLVPPTVLLAAVLAAACSGGGGGSSKASLSGALALPPDSGDAVTEAEPNDTVDQAHDLGTLTAGRQLDVLGSITDDGSDPFDAFTLVAPERVEVSVSLAFDNGNDLDVLVYDPLSMQFVESFDSGSANPEVGTFVVKGSFDLVLVAFAGASQYRLTISAAALTDPYPEREPNDDPGVATFLGELVQGDAVGLAGTADAATDATDRWILTFPEAATASFFLDVPAGADFELDLNDVTADLLSPVDLFLSNTAPGVDVGFSFSVSGGTALEVVVLAETGQGAYTLDVGGAAPVGGPGALVPLRPTELAREGGGPKYRGRAQRYGRAPLATAAGELLVALDAGVDPLEFARAHRLRHVDGVPGGVQRFALALAPGLGDEDARRATTSRARQLGAAAGVRYAEENWLHQRLDVPNDPFFNLQWHLPLIQVPAAWDLTTGSNAVVTAVIDTGQLDHPDLIGNQIAGYDFISDPSIAQDGDGRDADPTDEGDGDLFQPSSFHGTHVAGTIGAVSDNGIGVAGVNRLGRILHLRTLGKGGGTTFDILNAVLYAAGLPNAAGVLPAAPADVINMSLGGPGFSQAFQDACSDAWQAGSVVLAAAGNENSGTPSYPAAYDDVLSVAAVDQNGDRAPYSNFHATVDLAAPGGDTGVDLDGDGYADGVLSTLADDSGATTTFNYVFYQGTSMACPHAAGVAGLMLAANPSLTPDDVATILTSTATDLGAPGRDNQFGHGLVNAYQAVQEAQGGAPTDPVLGLSAQTLSFTPGVDDLAVQVSNLGGGQLIVTNLVASTSSGGGWLDATRVASSGGTSDTARIDVAVDRSGLADGVYAGSVRVDTNSSVTPSRTIQVTLIVGADAPVDIDIFVLVVEFDENGDPVTVAQEVVNPTTGLDWDFSGLAAGTYLLVAGTDTDGDDFICDEGETYCGLYPTLDDPVLLDVQKGEDLDGLDFTLVGDGASIGSAAAGGRGFRLLED